MFVVVAGQVVAGSLLGGTVARTFSGVVCRRGERKEDNGRSQFSEPKEDCSFTTLPHPHSPHPHSPPL